MRILLLGLNFHPELVGVGRYTGELANYLANQGFNLCVICSPPYYPAWRISEGYPSYSYQRQTQLGIEVIRCPLWVPKHPSGLKRIMHLLSFALSSFPIVLFKCIQQKPDIVLCIAPTIFSAPFALFAAKMTKAKTWLHIQDFELDAALGLNMIPGSRHIYPLAEKLERYILRHFDRVSTISKNMLKRCIQKGIQTKSAILFTNWVDTNTIYPKSDGNLLRSQLRLSKNQIVVLYHGNMGHKQGLDILIECAKRLQERINITFVLCGDGATRHELEESANGLSNLLFLDLQPESLLNELVNMADIHILPQLSNAADLVMPSKLINMLASGKPVIACANQSTQLWELVNHTGIVVPPEDVTALAKSIYSLAEDPAERAHLGQLGREYACTHLEKNLVLDQFIKDLNAMFTK